MTLESKIRKILKDGLVSPVLSLHVTYPEMHLTEKGYDTLLDNATEEIMGLIKKANK